MESAIAKYDHVVQCLQELKQIYRNAEMSETVLSPCTINFTQSGLYVRSHAIYKSCLKWQSFFRVIRWKTMETEAWFFKGLCPNNRLWSKVMSKGSFHTGFVCLIQDLSLFAFHLRTLVCFHICSLGHDLQKQLAITAYIQFTVFSFTNDGQLQIVDTCASSIVLFSWV